MLFPVTALMPGRKQYDNIFFSKRRLNLASSRSEGHKTISTREEQL